MGDQELIKPSRDIPVNIEDEMRKSYLDYAMSVIIGRALPDVRDGLKPVHRRILYAMYKEGNTSDKRYIKCAGVVGEVIKKYHPHGDAAVYDTLVRMAQGFNMRYTLIDGQGNFGSVDGDRAAVMSDVSFIQRATNRILRFRIGNFLRFKDGKLIEFREFANSFDVVEQALGRELEL